MFSDSKEVKSALLEIKDEILPAQRQVIQNLASVFWAGIGTPFSSNDVEIREYLNIYSCNYNYLRCLIFILEQANGNYLPIIERDQVAAFLKHEAGKRIIQNFGTSDGIFLNNYLQLLKFFVRKDQDTLNDYQILHDHSSHVVGMLGDGIESLIQEMIKQGRQLSDERLAFLINIWLTIPADKKLPFTILTDLIAIAKDQPDKYLELFKACIDQIDITKTTRIELTILVNALIAANKHNCVEILFEKYADFRLQQAIILNIINNNRGILKNYSEDIHGIFYNDGAIFKRDYFIFIEGSLEQEFEKYLKQYDIKNIKSIKEFEKYLSNKKLSISQEVWAFYLCQRLGEYSITRELKIQILEVLAKRLVSRKNTNLADEFNDFLKIAKRFFPDTRDPDRLSVTSKLLDKIQILDPSLCSPLTTSSFNSWIDAQYRIREFLKINPFGFQSITLFQRNEKIPIPFMIVWAALIMPEHREKILKEYEEFAKTYKGDLKALLEKSQFVIYQLIVIIRENAFEFFKRNMQELVFPLETAMQTALILPSSLSEIIKQAFDKYQIDYTNEKHNKLVTLILKVASAQLKINKLMGIDLQLQLSAYDTFLREAENLEEFYKKIAGYLIDTAFPEVQIDKNKVDIPYFIKQINAEKFNECLDKRKSAKFQVLFDGMLIFALTGGALATPIPESKQITDVESVTHNLTATLSGYEKFAVNFKKINEALGNNEHQKRDLIEFLFSHEAAISSLAAIMGKDTFSFLQKYTGTNVLALERVLQNLSADMPDELLVILQQVFIKYQTSIMSDKGYKKWEEILIKVGVQVLIYKETKSEELTDFPAYTRLLAESANLDAFDQGVSDHLIDTAFPTLGLDKSQIDMPAFLSKVNTGFFAKMLLARSKMKGDAYRQVFEEMLKRDINGNSVVKLLRGEEKGGSAIEKQLAEHNKNTRDYLSAKEVDVDKALTYQDKLEFTYRPGGESAADEISVLKNLWGFVLKLEEQLKKIPLPKDNSNKKIRENITKLIKQIGALKNIIKDANDVNQLQQLRSATGLDRLNIISNLLKFDATQLEKLPREFQEFCDHFRDAKKLFDAPRKVTTKLEEPQKFVVMQWNKDDMRTSLLGNYVGCCLATDGAHFPALVQRRMDDAMSFHVVIDKASDVPIALSWLYFAEDKNTGDIFVMANFLEMDSKYGSNTESRQTIFNALLYYTHEYCHKISKNPAHPVKFLINRLTYGWAQQYDTSMFEQREIQPQKVGGFLQLTDDTGTAQELYYLKSLECTTFHQFDPAKLSKEALMQFLPVNEEQKPYPSALAKPPIMAPDSPLNSQRPSSQPASPASAPIANPDPADEASVIRQRPERH